MLTLQTLTLLSLLSFALGGSPNPKRGFVGDGCKGAACQDVALLTAAGWYYAYNPGDPFVSPGTNNAHPQFTPMHWCLSGLNASLPPGVNSTFLLGYNEPNNAHNCNISPETAAVSWKVVLDRWAGTSQLVSPATAGNGIPWLDAFFGNCTKIYGPSGCRVTHVAVHDYTCDPQTLMTYLKQVHSRYNMPVWLTEFSCGDGAQAKPMADHLKYMGEVFPLLDAADYVYRYAWMSANGGERALVSGTVGGQQSLTPVGKLFNSA